MSDDAPVVFDKYRGEVEFKYLKNAVFRFRQKDLSSLSSRFGPEYLKKFEAAMENHDAAALEVFILAGLKEKGGGKYPIDDETIDDPPWPTTAPYGPMRAAMMFAITGLTAAEAEKAEAEAAAAAAAGDDLVVGWHHASEQLHPQLGGCRGAVDGEHAPGAA